MTTYTVTSQATGQEVYRYSANAPIEWSGMGFDTHDHTPLVEEITDVVPRMESARELTKRAWRLLFTDAERLSIDRFNATFETSPYLTEEQRDEVRSGLEDYKAATGVNRDDPATAKVLELYTALGFLEPGRAAEILA